jgi:hypothetical protein
MTARHVASHLAAVTEGVSRLEPPAEDAAAVQRHYVEPLMRASRVLTEAAARTPLRARFAEVVVSLDEQMALFTDDDDHDFVVTYGLPQWWEPRTETWEPRRRDHGPTP